MILIVWIWLLSAVGVVLFIPWMYERNLSVSMAVFLLICPVVNTIFLAYRTYKAFKHNSEKILGEFKKLFED